LGVGGLEISALKYLHTSFFLCQSGLIAWLNVVLTRDANLNFATSRAGVARAGSKFFWQDFIATKWS
jgi:hypothetical protein